MTKPQDIGCHWIQDFKLKKTDYEEGIEKLKPLQPLLDLVIQQAAYCSNCPWRFYDIAGVAVEFVLIFRERFKINISFEQMFNIIVEAATRILERCPEQQKGSMVLHVRGLKQ